MSARRQVDPGWTWDDKFTLSQAIQVGDSIYVSGQTAQDPEGNVVGKGDMKAQMRQVLENMKTVLETAGASMDDIVKVTVYTTDMSRLLETHEIRAQYFPDPPPASTGLEVKALASPDLLVEVEAVAVKAW